MKKHNDGYVLVLVLVVFLVLSLSAVALLSVSLSSLKHQQASIERMQAKYQAEGMTEEFIAALENTISSSPEISGTATGITDDEAMTQARAAVSTAVNELWENIENCINSFNQSDDPTSFSHSTGSIKEQFTVKAVYTENEITAAVDAEVTLNFVISVSIGDAIETNANNGNDDTKQFSCGYSVIVSDVSIGYASYTVSYPEGGGGQ